ncbi:MAG: hypothetical protein M1600_11675 [Firmicutes bacterium]|nr:hypothetical protein [Bacillota bacterium]
MNDHSPLRRTSLRYAVTVTSPAWLTALLIIGRGFAIDLVIQPLLNGLMGFLPDDRFLM